MKTLRPLLFGLVAGALLAELRAPIGFDLFDALTRDAGLDALLRAVALAAVACALYASRGALARELPVARLAAGTALGFLLAAVAPGSAAVHTSGGGLALRAALGVSVLFLLARPSRPEPARPSRSEADREPPAVRAELAGLLLMGAGAALALVGLERVTRLCGASQPEDGALFAGLFLIAMALLGVAGFATPLAPGGRLRPLLRLGAAAVPFAVWQSFGTASNLADPDVFGAQLASWNALLTERLHVADPGLGPSTVGTPLTDVLLGLKLLAVPAFLLGIGIGGARDGRRLGALLLGGALGVLTAPTLLAQLAAVYDIDSALVDSGTGRLVAYGAAVAAAGAALALFASGLRPAILRIALTAGLLLTPVTLVVRDASAALPLSPWDLFRASLDVAVDDPRGTLIVENLRDGSLAASLDRLRLTPSGAERAADDERIRRAFALLDPALRESGKARVLFVGQVDPGRWRTLQSLGAARVDRSVPWVEGSSELEGRLFHGEPERPAGEPLSPSAARRAVDASQYDLVLGCSPYGPMPKPRSAQVLEPTAAPAPGRARWRAPDETLVVVWLDAASGLEEVDLGERVLLASDGIDQLSVGVVLGASEGFAAGRFRATSVPAGRPDAARSTLDRAGTLMRERADERRTAFTERLARAAAGTPSADLTAGLARFFGAQVASSPFESAAEQRELDAECLPLLAAAAESELSPFLRGFWSGLAELMVDKRSPDLVLKYVEPLADQHAPWPAADRAVAGAYREFGMPSEAADRLARSLAAEPYDVDGWILLGTLRMQAGEDSLGALALVEALALQPGRHDVERALGIALVRAGDPAGQALVEAAAARAPEDAELRRYLESGPYPPLDPSFTIESSHGDHEEHADHEVGEPLQLEDD